MRFAHETHRGAASYEISLHESLDLIRAEPVGRICILEQGMPIAFPVNYKVTGGGDVVMRTAPETAIGRYQGSACLEVDRIDLDRGVAWSVIVRGRLRPMLGEVGDVDPEPMLETGRTRWMMLDVNGVSGRRFVVSQGRDFAVDWQLEGT